MPKRPRVAIAFAIGLAAIVIPIVASIYLAWAESVATERARSLSYAREVLHRLEETAGQYAAGKRRLDAANYPPCSAEDLDLLRQIAVGSNYLQAVARTSGDSLMCDSMGETTPIPLGKPSLISAHGVSEYFNVKLWEHQWQPLNVFAANGFAIIIDTKLAVDIPTEGQDVELATFVPSVPGYRPFESVGRNFPSRWFNPVTPGGHTTFIDSGYLVSSERSTNWDLGVIAATPESYVYRRVRQFALIFTPVGILCGVLLAWAVSSVTRTLTSFPNVVRRAARNGDYFVEYQPIVELPSRRIIGAEALVRWNAPMGPTLPEFFIPLAEERGLIHLITEQVLLVVGQDLPKMLALDTGFRIGLNMSATDLRVGDTKGILERMLSTSGAKPQNVEIEATERAFLQGPDTILLIRSLREAGYRVAIDDFGTGYSSLAAVQTLSLDTLKIDKTFVETINTDGVTSQVVLHIIELAHSMGLEMIAEGVETEVQAQFLAQRGVRFAQGYLFGRPMALEALLGEMTKTAAIKDTTVA